jgi:uncharacterized protein YcgI (DUF1989 family)
VAARRSAHFHLVGRVCREIVQAHLKQEMESLTNLQLPVRVHVAERGRAHFHLVDRVHCETVLGQKKKKMKMTMRIQLAGWNYVDARCRALLHLVGCISDCSGTSANRKWKTTSVDKLQLLELNHDANKTPEKSQVVSFIVLAK